MDIFYTILRELAEPPSLDACRPLEYPGDVAALEQWRVVPTESGPYLLKGLLAGRGICSVVFAVYGRALARIAERWVVLGRPLDGTLSEVRRRRRDPQGGALDRRDGCQGGSRAHRLGRRPRGAILRDAACGGSSG